MTGTLSVADKLERGARWIRAWIETAGLTDTLDFVYADDHPVRIVWKKTHFAVVVSFCIDDEQQDSFQEYPVHTFERVRSRLKFYAGRRNAAKQLFRIDARAIWEHLFGVPAPVAATTLVAPVETAEVCLPVPLTEEEQEALGTRFVQAWIEQAGLKGVVSYEYNMGYGLYKGGMANRESFFASVVGDINPMEFPQVLYEYHCVGIRRYSGPNDPILQLLLVDAKAVWAKLVAGAEPAAVPTATTALVVAVLTEAQKKERILRWVALWIEQAGLKGRATYDGGVFKGNAVRSFGVWAYLKDADTCLEFPHGTAQTIANMVHGYHEGYDIKRLLDVDAKACWDRLYGTNPAGEGVSIMCESARVALRGLDLGGEIVAAPARRSPRSTTELLEALRLVETSNFTVTAKDPADQERLQIFLGSIHDLLLELTEV